MENQTDYEKAKEMSEQDMEQAAGYSYQCFLSEKRDNNIDIPAEEAAHKWGFYAGYNIGEIHASEHIPGAAKKVDRTMIAAMAMQGIITSEPYLYALHDKVGMEGGGEELLAKLAAKAALYYANALIAELEKEEK